MKIRLFWGNPIVIVLVSVVFSIILVAISIVTLLNGHVFEGKYAIFSIFVTFYNCVAMIAFYIAYKHEIKTSKNAFMSPKKYKKSVMLGGQYDSTINRLKSSLRNIDESIDQLDDDAIIDRVVEAIESNDAKTIRG
jgi:flagellar motor component MotA